MKLSIHGLDVVTAAQLRRRHQRFDRRIARSAREAERILAAMQRGAVLHLHFQSGGRAIWSLSTGIFVPADTAASIIANPNIVPDGDVLPLLIDTPSQTWRWAEQ
jgi:hypothetical protein